MKISDESGGQSEITDAQIAEMKSKIEDIDFKKAAEEERRLRQAYIWPSFLTSEKKYVVFFFTKL